VAGRVTLLAVIDAYCKAINSEWNTVKSTVFVNDYVLANAGQ
jgi:hypothetical protein